MAIGWLTALKVIPWTDVIQATPGIVRGARQFWQNIRHDDRRRTERASETPLPDERTEPLNNLQARVRQLEAERDNIQAKAMEAAELVEALATQHERLVEVVGRLRSRTRIQLVAIALLAVAVVILFVRS